MPSLSLLFDSYNRPLVTVEVKPALPLQQQFFTAPPNVVPSVKVDFLVDTGAADCVIDEQLVIGWRLPRNMPVLIGSTARPQVLGYRLPLALRLLVAHQSATWYHGTWSVATVNDGRFDDQAFKGIIGMDMLSLGSLIYTGGSNGRTCELTWP